MRPPYTKLNTVYTELHLLRHTFVHYLRGSLSRREEYYTRSTSVRLLLLTLSRVGGLKIADHF